MKGFHPPTHRLVFRVKYDDGTNKQVVVHEWNRGGAWAMLCRDVAKLDHGDTKKIVSVMLVASGDLTDVAERQNNYWKQEKP